MQSFRCAEKALSLRMGKVTVPTIKHDGHDWGQLNYFGHAHIFAGEKVSTKDEKYSFVGGHRVRLYSIKANVHWRIPAGINVDITAVQPANVPQQRRHTNR